MITYSKRRVFPTEYNSFEFPPVAPSLDDIAVGLSRINRFAGQTKHLYSVLQHSFVVSELVSDAARVYALLHDAPECVVSDVPTTWKTDAAREYEFELMRRICLEHNLVWPAPEELWDEVKHIDGVVLAAEAHVLGHNEASVWWPRSKWCEYTYTAEYKTIVYLDSTVGRLCEFPSEAVKVFKNRFSRALEIADSSVFMV